MTAGEDGQIEIVWSKSFYFTAFMVYAFGIL